MREREVSFECTCVAGGTRYVFSVRAWDELEAKAAFLERVEEDFCRSRSAHSFESPHVSDESAMGPRQPWVRSQPEMPGNERCRR